MQTVLDHWGCYNKIPQLINNTSIFPTVLEAVILRSGCHRGQMKALFQMVNFLPYPQVLEGAKDLSGASNL